MRRLSVGLLLGICALAGSPARGDNGYLLQSPGANSPADIDQWRKGEDRGGLKPYPDKCPPGTPNPADPLWMYGGSSVSSFSLPDMNMPFSEWIAKQTKQRPEVDRRAHEILEKRYDLACHTEKGVVMSRGKPQPIGPTARLPKAFASWDAYAAQSPDAIRKAGTFPYLPLDHPLQSTAHQVFPDFWTKVHPEHERFDVGMDIPDCFLPEFPPPLYLTTHKELGDVTRGVEITYGNYFNMFNGLLTPEQLDGLRLMVTPFPTTWFNTTHHRVTKAPSEGVSCLACHVNGHTNGGFELEPASRPNWARLRVDTPSLRGNYSMLIFSSKRGIRGMDHFSEVEEYFDGDTAMLAAIGGRNLEKAQTNHMGDFNSIIDFPPAPKLDALNRLIPEKSTASELRGEKIFNGKGLCFQCHPAANQFQDNSMHDLKVERFYPGRPEGPIKTFALRGIKDSPPYLHDGRLLTLEDAVQFFDIVDETHLTAEERKDLTAYLRAL